MLKIRFINVRLRLVGIIMEFVRLLEYFCQLLPITSRLRARRVGGAQRGKLQISTNFTSVAKCSISESRENQNLVCNLDGTLLRSRSPFPYFMLMAFEAGSPVRALVLLLVWPLVWFLFNFVSEAAGIRVMIFVTFVGLRLAEAKTVSRAVLPKFYLEDMHPQSYRVFVSCGKRCVVSSSPRIMVEPFLMEYLNVDCVLGTELQVVGGGYCSGLVGKPGVLVGVKRQKAVKDCFGERQPDIGVGDVLADYPFMSLCKEAYIGPSNKKVDPVPREQYLKPMIFHDGRLVSRPTPMNSLVIFLWFPIGILLAMARMLAGLCLPYSIALPLTALLGVRMRVKGAPPVRQENNKGVLYVCSHRTLLDPLFLSSALGRPVTAVTYSLSRMSEILAPIKTVRLTRNRNYDGQTMQTLLNEGDLVVCPEGTTCREPYLLRFSCLFAELADDIVPVTMNATVSMFYGTTARGFKCFDPIFYLMNPSPCYDIEFLEKLPKELTCSGGKSSFEVANYIQKKLADALGFQCTNFTRRDKYLMLAGNEGLVPESKRILRTHKVASH